MMFPLPDSLPRHALVTGGAKRLGAAMARALVGAGFDVTIHVNASREAGEALAAELRASGRRAQVIAGDLSREVEVQPLVAAAVAGLGPLGVLVNNASTFERDEWDDATRESWDHHIEPNLRAPFVLSQHFAKQLPAGAEGVVVNMLDQRVLSLTPHFVTYTLSKAGLWALTQQLALALAPRIRVLGIGPGPAMPSPRQSQEQFDRQCRSVPLQRGTSPEEIGRALLALLALPSVTGQVICLDGGQHLQWASSPAGAPPEE
jgi:NAD(P)-dependent dehydrogenase (short-subunit alcohol dehydrogenase family)